MRNFKLHFLFIATLLLFSSCQEEYPLPSNDYPVLASNNTTQPGVSMWGKFKLVSAVMYVVNNETNQKTVYNHFGPNKTVSSLRWGGSIYEIETIIQDSTTFSFYQPVSYPGYGKFVLNGDTTKYYSVYYIGMNKTIVEDPVQGMNQQMMGGSARPFSGQTIDYATGMVRIQIQEVQGSIDGYNCRYWSELTFKKIESW